MCVRLSQPKAQTPSPEEPCKYVWVSVLAHARECAYACCECYRAGFFFVLLRALLALIGAVATIVLRPSVHFIPNLYARVDLTFSTPIAIVTATVGVGLLQCKYRGLSSVSTSNAESSIPYHIDNTIPSTPTQVRECQNCVHPAQRGRSRGAVGRRQHRPADTGSMSLIAASRFRAAGWGWYVRLAVCKVPVSGCNMDRKNHEVRRDILGRSGPGLQVLTRQLPGRQGTEQISYSNCVFVCVFVCVRLRVYVCLCM